MCEFHLKGQCFHPQKAKKGVVAVTCTFSDCSDCTNKNWQEKKVSEDYAYYQSIVKLANVHIEPELPVEEQTKKPLLTRIFDNSRVL